MSEKSTQVSGHSKKQRRGNDRH